MRVTIGRSLDENDSPDAEIDLGGGIVLTPSQSVMTVDVARITIDAPKPDPNKPAE